MTKDEMVGWHHRLSGHEFEQTREIVKDRGARYATVHGVTKELDITLATKQQQYNFVL